MTTQSTKSAFIETIYLTECATTTTVITITEGQKNDSRVIKTPEIEVETQNLHETRFNS